MPGDKTRRTLSGQTPVAVDMAVDVQNTVARYFALVDGRRWPELEALMTHPFHLDYSSFGAGDAADLEPSAILAGWRRLLPGFDHTHCQWLRENVVIWCNPLESSSHTPKTNHHHHPRHRRALGILQNSFVDGRETKARGLLDWPVDTPEPSRGKLDPKIGLP